MRTVELAVQAAREIDDFRVPLSNGAQDDLVSSILVAMVPDSASCTVGAEVSLTLLHLSMLFSSCFGHQFNLLTGEILTHPGFTTTVTSFNFIFALFSRSTKYMGMIEECMDSKQTKPYKLVKRGKTWWYCHLAQVKRLLLVKAALEVFSIRHCSDLELMATVNGSNVVGLLHSARFWVMTEHRSKLLRSIVIEIGLIERRSSNVADVCAFFRRLAYFQRLKAETVALAANGATALAPLFAVPTDPNVTAISNQVPGSVLGRLQA